MSSAFADPKHAALWSAGTVLGGRYRLKEPIGRGAMGEVWLADHTGLGIEVAVKVVDLAARGDEKVTRARFQREAHAAAQLKSPNVVKILDHGDEGRVAFIAMELLEGKSLEDMLANCRRLSPQRLARYIGDVAKAIDKAHAAGIIHRDLKPSNVFIVRVDGEEVAKVLDFGLAKLTAEDREAQLTTQHGMLVGTPAYMSPEQVLGHKLDHRSDLWQLAILAYECLCGERPFEGNALGDLYLRICSEPLPVPSSVATVPEGFDAWFAKAARRNPRERFQSATELADELVRVCRRPLVATSSPAENTASTSFSMSLAPPKLDVPALQSARRPRAVAFPLATVPLALIVLGASLLLADFGADRDKLGGSEVELALPPAAAAGQALVKAVAAPPPSPPATAPEPAKTAAPAASSSAKAPAPKAKHHPRRSLELRAPSFDRPEKPDAAPARRDDDVGF